MQTVTTNWLKQIEALKDVPDEQLQWLIDNSVYVVMENGDRVFEPGEPISGTFFIVEGNVTIYRLQNGSRQEFDPFEPGDITGYLPYSRGKIAFAYAEAIGHTEVMKFPIEKSMEMIRNHFELTQALVHVMSDRVREITALQQQNEKMMALGKLSAGLAHELNNPASAIVRDSVSLKRHLQLQPDTFRNIIGIQMSPEQLDGVTGKLFTILSEGKHARLTLKQRNEREEQLSDWLDEREVDNSYDLAENFTAFDLKLSDLDHFGNCLPEKHLSPVLNWINNVLVTEKMVDDIQESSQRISKLVCSVKNYTHMDRAQDRQFADIHNGIDNTLTMLGYKLKKGNITLVKDYDETLPEVKALIGELNQVWTNLIDNALDAMEPAKQGTLTIRTRKSDNDVHVHIIDDGPGIPADIQAKIFDAFFTTKEMGKGTGMGLEVVHRIVVQHHGSIKVTSQPGKTEFSVCFPING